MDTWKKQQAQKSIGVLLRWLMLSLLLVGTHAFAQTGGTVTYVYTDPQGTPLAETDASGNITATFEYTPYGTYAPQGTSTPGLAPKGPGYTGHVNDPETNLVYMQARYYDPVTGRFLSVDPVKTIEGDEETFNRYTYARNNPVGNIDPDGKMPGTDNGICRGSGWFCVDQACSFCFAAGNNTPSNSSVTTLPGVIVRAAMDTVLPATPVAPDPKVAAKYSNVIADVEAAAIMASGRVPLWVPQPLRGVMVHSEAARIIREQNPMYRTEVSYYKGLPATYGNPFSSRFDVVYQDPTNLKVIGFDIKTGNAYITRGQLNRYVSNAPKGALIIQVKVP